MLCHSRSNRTRSRRPRAALAPTVEAVAVLRLRGSYLAARDRGALARHQPALAGLTGPRQGTLIVLCLADGRHQVRLSRRSLALEALVAGMGCFVDLDVR